ncbi:hypothetical protein BX600DRAFT_481678 [Xylariales sp. PMI_506]|nr:hypothetical protein BX600DRAFT_481678 [Xylariales sp. PMI_506]
MALSMLLALTTCPAMLGTQEAIRESQSKTRREEHRAQRCNLIVRCTAPSIRSGELHYKSVVLVNSKLYIATGEAGVAAINEAHRFCGYFLPYPDANFEGLVSTITDAAPILNWIYVDKETSEVKYGIRTSAQPNLTGPFDSTRQDRRLTLEGWEGFVAVEEHPGVWALYFDSDDNGLAAKIPPGTRVLEVELIRSELKVPKPSAASAQTLEEKMQQLQQQDKEQKTG